MHTNVSTVRVRYAETDQMGVVYYANYFIWFEVARTDWLRSLGETYRAMEENGVMLPVIEASCQYKRPARYDDELEIRTDARLQSPVRLEFAYEVSVKGTPGLVAVGTTRHAALGSDGKPRRLPPHIREVLA